MIKRLKGNGSDSFAINSDYSYSWIIATRVDVSSRLKSILPKHNNSLKNNIFFVSPLTESTSEYQGYFETMVKTIGIQSDQPLIVEFAKAVKQYNVPGHSIAHVAKAVWILNEAYKVSVHHISLYLSSYKVSVHHIS